MGKVRTTILALVVPVLVFFGTSGGFLIINEPQPSDVIVILAGEADRRPVRGLELLSQNYAPRVILDVESGAKIYNSTMPELAQHYVQRLPQNEFVSLCPLEGLSTKAEAQDAAQCLQRWKVHNVLLVTSDYHTRRALSIFRHELPEYHFSVAAAFDSQQFGAHWWRHRQWAKVNLSEWLRLIWWQAVDRWH